MSNCSDTGLQGSSSMDNAWMEFVADGPGIAGFKFEVDPEVDGDAFAASFDPFLRPENTETCFSEWDDDGRHLSLEALAAESGYEPTTFDADDDHEEEPAILRDQCAAERFLADEEIEERPWQGAVTRWRQSPQWRNVAKKAAAVVVDSRDAVRTAQAELRRKAEETKKPAAKSEPAKGNGNGHKPVAPPVGKYLAGTVVDHGPKGLLVDIGNGMEARVPIALEMGHGSWERAADWILGFKPGASVRIRVIRVNGVIEAVLSDRHPRPFWKKEASEQIEASPAN